MSDDELGYESALRRAFVDKKYDKIIITSRREMYQIKAASYGIAQGWLEGEFDNRDEQSSAWILRLTDEGKEHFHLNNNETNIQPKVSMV